MGSTRCYGKDVWPEKCLDDFPKNGDDIFLEYIPKFMHKFLDDFTLFNTLLKHVEYLTKGLKKSQEAWFIFNHETVKPNS